jgi:hypothetical protein
MGGAVSQNRRNDACQLKCLGDRQVCPGVPPCGLASAPRYEVAGREKRELPERPRAEDYRCEQVYASAPRSRHRLKGAPHRPRISSRR